MRRLNMMALLTAVLVGCATSDRHTSRPARDDDTVLFPQVELRDGEFIEGLKMRIKGGRVSAIERIPNDWDIAVEWQDGSCLELRGRARHFSGGLPSIDRLNEAIVVQSGPDTRIQAVVTTDRTDPAGGGGRKIPFRSLALRGQPSPGSSSAASISQPFHVAGTVTDARNGKPIPEFRVTPRYAIAGKNSPAHGEWDEYEGERFQGGKFALTYDHPLLVGSVEPPGWQFLVEAEGYEPFVSRVIGAGEASPSLHCPLNFANPK